MTQWWKRVWWLVCRTYLHGNMEGYDQLSQNKTLFGNSSNFFSKNKIAVFKVYTAFGSIRSYSIINAFERRYPILAKRFLFDFSSNRIKQNIKREHESDNCVFISSLEVKVTKTTKVLQKIILRKLALFGSIEVPDLLYYN